MYVRETQRRNRDGSVVRYLALAHNERDPATGVPKAKVIHNFGRSDQVDRDALRRLVRSIGRFLEPAEVVLATATGEVRILDSRPMGAAWVADQLWRRLGIGEAIASVARGRRLDAELVERAIFAMVANRLSDRPRSKRGGCKWVAERVFIDGLDALSDDACYRAMDFLLGALGELQERVFFSVANLLNLEVDLLFFDTTSTYWQTDAPDEALLPEPGADEGDEAARAVERAWRTWGHSKDHRRDLPQVVIGMAVTREGVPVRCWTFPGNTSDQVPIRTVKDDLRDWRLNRVVWVLYRGFSSEANRRYLQRAGGGYIMGEKLRGLQRGRRGALPPGPLPPRGREPQGQGGPPGRRRRPGPLRHLPQPRGRQPRLRGPRADRSPPRRGDRLIRRPPGAGAGRACGPAQDQAGLQPLPAHHPLGQAPHRPRRLPPRRPLRRQVPAPHLGRVALGRRHRPGLQGPVRGRAGLAGPQDGPDNLRPVFHHKDTRIQAHGQLCWLALLVLRTAEIAVGDTWRNIREELDRLHLVTLATAEGQVAQRGELTPGQRSILRALQLPEPPRFFDFAPGPA